MFNSITSRLSLIDADLKVASPTAHLNALKWMASTACEWALNSFVDDAMAKDTKFYQMREEKRANLARVASYAMDNGLPAQAIEGDGPSDTVNGLINEAITKELNATFKAKSISQEHMELLVECGEDEEVLLLMQEGENVKNERIAKKRKMKLEDAESGMRHDMSHWFMATFNASPNLDNIHQAILKQVIMKYDYAMQAQRKYCIRGVQLGNMGCAGELKMINEIIKRGDIGWCLDRLEELERQSDFDDSGTITRGKPGDDERPDITY